MLFLSDFWLNWILSFDLFQRYYIIKIMWFEFPAISRIQILFGVRAVVTSKRKIVGSFSLETCYIIVIRILRAHCPSVNLIRRLIDDWYLTKYSRKIGGLIFVSPFCICSPQIKMRRDLICEWPPNPSTCKRVVESINQIGHSSIGSLKSFIVR